MSEHTRGPFPATGASIPKGATQFYVTSSPYAKPVCTYVDDDGNYIKTVTGTAEPIKLLIDHCSVVNHRTTDDIAELLKHLIDNTSR